MRTPKARARAHAGEAWHNRPSPLPGRPPLLTDYEILAALRPALRPLTPGSSGGSHTEVMAFVPALLEEALADLAASQGQPVDPVRARARTLADRFLVKVGNIGRYVVKLSGGRESIIPRRLVSEAFGPTGYNLAPTLDKVLVDAREAVREIPYFAFGPREAQFAPDVLEQVRRAATGTRGDTRHDGTFLVLEDGAGRRHLDAWEILSGDPYFPSQIKDFYALERFQSHLRAHPLDRSANECLRPFFDAPMTVGVRDVLRWLEGSRHPTLGWEAAEAVIRSCFDSHGDENFLPPEINYYTRTADVDPADARRLGTERREVAAAFARWMVARLPFRWTADVPDAELVEVAAGVLGLHFDYPLFEVEPYSGVFSAATLRLALRAAVGATVWLSGLDVPERRNPLTPPLAERSRPVAAFLARLTEAQRSEACNVLNAMLWEVAVQGGVPSGDGRILQWRRHDRTFYSFQEKAQHALAGRARVDRVLPLDALRGPEGEAILDRSPGLARQLVVFFTLAYRYFSDTGHAPDLRPDDVGRDLVLRGEWGDNTRNVLVVLGTAPDGRPVTAVRFVDNKDQFKQYRRWEDRAHPLGLAKHGLRLVEPLVRPGMERSLGRFVARVGRDQGHLPDRAPDVPRDLARATRQVLRAGVDSALSHTEAFLHDLIDDTADGVERSLRSLPAGRRPGDGA